jgi:Cellulase (glycosyl hydrolase family 5)
MKTIVSLSPGGRARHLIAGLTALLLVACAVVLAVAASGCGNKTPDPSPSVTQHGFMRGLWDDTFVGVDKAKQDAILSEIADQLHVNVVRLMVFWDRTEPQRGVFDDTYLASVKQAVQAARAHGLTVILTTYETPEWAQDKSFWKHPPGGFKANTYYSFYAPRADAIPQYGAFARHISQYFKGEVFAYECWNEPNIMWFLYPQQVPGDNSFGVRTYFSMLRQFYAGIKANDTQALVLGGNTASHGNDNVQSTSPLTWAEWLKKNNVLKYCDAYSHHAYNVGTVATKPPEVPPTYRQATVTLGNIEDLLGIFPKTDFYLTEYGYNSRYSSLFGVGSGVGEVNEADYLKRAFHSASGYPQIKLLMWYLRVDVKGEKGNTFSPAMSTGLRLPDLTKKPAWWAFAGQNEVTEEAPSGKAVLGSTFTLSGRVTHAGQPVAGISLTVEMQVGSSGGAWQASNPVVTDAQGRYSFAFKVKDYTLYYVSWPGVTDGEQLSVTPQ